ncbi:MAG: glycerophosphodiester phosphodiesterase [Alphaproteobacteria bacterium]|nr:glycerophosphodiester phosphodiesterase [Alphaproteobacteria bacterium]MBM3733779.1 glycerophosphodiester phosphodiesterase [Acidimicrobiia bacterium]MBM3950547.1 glycerophosphodiester phosphodiesterase [Rhodospirillales bacterium]
MERHPPQVPRVIGHRGAAGHAPENTIASLAAAARLGARWVEFDVKLAGTGEPILFHDETLERTTDGKGKVAETSLARLKKLDAGSWYQARYQDERIPTLEEALVVLARLGLGANVEIKPCPGRERETGEVVARALKARWPGRLPAPLLSSFNAGALVVAAAAAPEFPRALIFREPPGNWRALAEETGATAIHCNGQFLDRARVVGLRGAGYAVRAYTVNDVRSAAQLFAWGVESVFSDYPERILGVLE